MIRFTGPSLEPGRVAATTSPDARSMRLVAQARLSGAVYSAAASNPVDLTVPSFHRVTDVEIDERHAVIGTSGVFVTEDDLDW